MAEIGSKFGLGGSAGIHFTDPAWFQKTINFGSRVSTKGVITDRLSTAAEFWTQGIAVRGAADDTNWTADTYKTLANISGKGVVYNIIGPTGLAGTPTTTVRVTRDGVQTIISELSSELGLRLVLGALWQGTATGAHFNAAGVAFYGAEAFNAGKTAQTNAPTGTPYGWLMDFGMLETFGTPGLFFSQSCLVEMKTSETNSTTTNRERSSGVVYRKFA